MATETADTSASDPSAPAPDTVPATPDDVATVEFHTSSARHKPHGGVPLHTGTRLVMVNADGEGGSGG